VLGLCGQAGLVKVGMIAIDGTKVHANASQHANRDYEQLARELLEEAAEVDRLEDEQVGEARGDELPPELSTAQGRRGWPYEAKRRLDERRAEQSRPIPASRPARLKEAKRRLDEELGGECRTNAAYAAYRARRAEALLRHRPRGVTAPPGRSLVVGALSPLGPATHSPAFRSARASRI
jgi:hypothetical protein